MNSKKPKRRIGTIPDGYPVDPAKIPWNMPVEDFHLMTTGHLTPADYEQYGFSHGWAAAKGPDLCAYCSQPVSLFWLHKPLGVDFFVKPGQKQAGISMAIPRMVWGEDVMVLCPCCSTARCKHRKEAA